MPRAPFLGRRYIIRMRPGPTSDKARQAKDLSETLRTHREEILTRWADLCRDNGRARQLSQEQLLDHLPHLLDRLAAAVDAASEGRDTSFPIKESREHTLHRLDAGFDLPDITQEYALLRQVLFSILRDKAPHLVIGGFDVVGSAIDASLSESVDYYVSVRHRTLEALDQVAQVSTGPGDADTTLHQILSVMMHTVPSVDSVTVLLRHGDVLKVKEALGVIGERDREFSIKVGEGFAGTIAASGRPMFLSSAGSDPIVRSEFIRQRNIKAMYGVPMMRGAEVIGVAHMASLTAHEFAEEDKLLFRTVAVRATSIIVQDELMAGERTSRLFLETVIGNIHEGVLVVDDEANVILASDGATRIFGVTRDELLGPMGNYERFRPRSPTGEARVPAVLEALQGNSLPPHERIVTDAKGQDHFVVVSAAPVQHGGVAGAVVVFTDITERRRLEEQFERAVAFRERIMGIVSHDLRTPLTAIGLAAQSVLRREGAPEWALSAALRVNRAVERMRRMVSDLLDFTRIQAHSGMPIERARVDLCNVVHDAVAELEAAHPARIALAPGCREAFGMWDGDRLAQVVTNLVNNALQHGSPDEPVEVGVDDRGDHVEVTVTNRGPTIPPEELPVLFDPFRRATGGERGRGLGLGLHIVYEVVKGHGGDVRVESRRGVTRFTVTLPRSA